MKQASVLGKFRRNLTHQDLILLATIKVTAAAYPHISIGGIVELAAQYRGLIVFKGGEVFLSDKAIPALAGDVFAANADAIPDFDAAAGADNDDGGDLSPYEARLLDALAEYGDQAKVTSAQVAEKTGGLSRQIGKAFSALENRGYVTKVSARPVATWRALEDSKGNPCPAVAVPHKKFDPKGGGR